MSGFKSKEQSRKLILGSGLAAGLAANLLAAAKNISLVWARDVQISPIPELLPRRQFFDALDVTQCEEALAVSEVAPSVQEVVWVEGGTRRTRRLVSTDEFLVYEKGRLAAWLRDRAIAAGVPSIMLDKPSETVNLNSYQLVLDCRGYNAVSNNPDYEVTRETQARTSCTYAIFNRPESIAVNQMVFWSMPGEGKVQQTFFYVPFGGDAMSVGCSCTPTKRIDINTVLGAARDFGLPVDAEHIRFTGEATPHIDIVKALTPHVKPIGEAARRSCPLTEYGAMVALSQLLQLVGKSGLPSLALIRPTHYQIDPHIPLELFL